MDHTWCTCTPPMIFAHGQYEYDHYHTCVKCGGHYQVIKYCVCGEPRIFASDDELNLLSTCVCGRQQRAIEMAWQPPRNRPTVQAIATSQPAPAQLSLL